MDQDREQTGRVSQTKDQGSCLTLPSRFHTLVALPAAPPLAADVADVVCDVSHHVHVVDATTCSPTQHPPAQPGGPPVRVPIFPIVVCVRSAYVIGAGVGFRVESGAVALLQLDL